jgi:outer membrane protein TolC
MLAAASERLESAREGASAEHRGLLPDLAVYGQLQDDRNSLSAGRGSGTLGATLRWNAFDPSRSRRLAGAQAELRAAEQELRAAADQARLEVESAFRRAQAARERHAAAEGGALEGHEALRVIRERRQSGLATLTDELETEAASLAAELEELEAAVAVAIADASLRRAAGETELPIDAQTR